MHDRKEQIHLVWNMVEMWRNVAADVNRLFPVAPAELSDVRDSSIVKGPKRVFVESFDALFYADLNAIGKKIVLTQKVLHLNFCVQLRIIFFSYGHKKGPSSEPSVRLRQKLNVLRRVPNALLRYA